MNLQCCPNHPSSAFPRNRRNTNTVDTFTEANIEEVLRTLDAELLEERNTTRKPEVKESFSYLNQNSSRVNVFKGTFTKFKKIIEREEGNNETCEEQCRQKYCSKAKCSDSYKKCLSKC